jgi:hypothetical protein
MKLKTANLMKVNEENMIRKRERVCVCVCGNGNGRRNLWL